MARPTKPFAVLVGENKSHRTKKELKQREQGEAALLTGTKMKERPEVKSDPVAHKEFLRLNALLKKIDKNDAIYEGVINRYCVLYAECLDFEHKREAAFDVVEQMRQDRDDLIESEEMTAAEYYRTLNGLQNNLIALDKQIQAKRKMLLAVEKENIMTIAGALRGVPKKAEEAPNPILIALSGNKDRQVPNRATRQQSV